MIKHIYVPIKRRYSSHIGLAERLIKKRLEKQRWEVWRGGFIDAIRHTDLYPNVYRKYSRLCRLLGKRCETLQYLCAVHHGMPDFICHRQGFKFVECKLGHEQLSPGQKKCFLRLQELGFEVEVHKIVFPCTKLRRAYVDIRTKEKVVLERQTRLRLRY